MGVGEETGRTDEVLERVAVYYEGEVNNLVKRSFIRFGTINTCTTWYYGRISNYFCYYTYL